MLTTIILVVLGIGFLSGIVGIIRAPKAYKDKRDQERRDAEDELLRIRKLYDSGVIDMAEWQRRKRECERKMK